MMYEDFSYHLSHRPEVTSAEYRSVAERLDRALIYHQWTDEHRETLKEAMRLVEMAANRLDLNDLNERIAWLEKQKVELEKAL